MRQLLGVAVVLALIVVGVGLSRGWFVVSSPVAVGGGNKVNVNLEVDRDKIDADASAVKNEGAKLTHRVQDATK
jgi:hypothetical protein